MTDKLVEAVARAIYERIHTRNGSTAPWSLLSSSRRIVWLNVRRCDRGNVWAHTLQCK